MQELRNNVCNISLFIVVVTNNYIFIIYNFFYHIKQKCVIFTVALLLVSVARALQVEQEVAVGAGVLPAVALHDGVTWHQGWAQVFLVNGRV